MQIIKKHIIAYSIMFQVSYKTSKIPTHCLYKTASIQFIDTNIIGDVKVNTTNTTSLVT